MNYQLKIRFTQRALISPATGEAHQHGFCAEIKLPTLEKNIMIPTKTLSLPSLAVAKRGSSPIHLFTALGMMCDESETYEELEDLIQVLEETLEETETFTYQILCYAKQAYQTYQIDKDACRTALFYLKSLRPRQ